MEAQWSPQWSLNGRHWSAKGGTMVVRGRQTCRSNWYTMFALFTGRPMADHCASILRPRRCVCLHPASFERPVSDRPPRRALCDCFEHAQNFTATMASMAMSERPMCHPWTTKATVRPPFCLQRRPGQFCGRTREAQRSQPLCKGGISNMSSVLQRLLHQPASCPATGTAWLWWLTWAGAWLCYPLMWLSIYNKEWDITIIQPISSTSTSEVFKKALVDIWIDLYLIKFQFLAILCVFVFLPLEEFFITGVQSCPY